MDPAVPAGPVQGDPVHLRARTDRQVPADREVPLLDAPAPAARADREAPADRPSLAALRVLVAPVATPRGPADRPDPTRALPRAPARAARRAPEGPAVPAGRRAPEAAADPAGPVVREAPAAPVVPTVPEARSRPRRNPPNLLSRNPGTHRPPADGPSVRASARCR
ncbi:hypothetical protein GCM10009675_28530 [Prauserella alba]|uniref:Uncharacterized protein n=1 Tax=Prauserella alba TaxID=176898 RepID=A0ABN1VE15_9PSEU